MAALVCDICGGKLVMGSGGIAVCDSCGMEHSPDRMKEKVQEITTRNCLAHFCSPPNTENIVHGLICKRLVVYNYDNKRNWKKKDVN